MTASQLLASAGLRQLTDASHAPRVHLTAGSKSLTAGRRVVLTRCASLAVEIRWNLLRHREVGEPDELPGALCASQPSQQPW